MISTLWKHSRPLGVTVGAMLFDLVFTLCALAFDPRVIGGAPAWLKPAKFALSSFIFAASVAWLFQYMPRFPKTTRSIGFAIACILILENVIIDFQAARGVTSHFNTSSAENSALYAVMGVAIAVLLVLTIVLVVLLFRQPFKDGAWGWALRLGLLISVLGSSTGGLMTQPTSDQLATLRHHAAPTAIGAHTVGAPDGGPGVPGVGWSKEHGDLRIAHFFGLHALQIIPLLAWWARRIRTNRFVFAISASYFGLFVILLWQALRGESIAQPSSLTLSAFGIWLVSTFVAAFPFERKAIDMEAVHER